MQQPTNFELEKFLKIFDTLCQFEASQRVVRGYGCFKEDELPFNEVVKVISWLKEKSSRSEKDYVDSLIQKYQSFFEELKHQATIAYSKNDYATYSELNDEADIYEKILNDLKNFKE
jgi:hypothetical protein